MIKVYIASPYGKRLGISVEALEKNVGVQIAMAREIILRGCNPFVPTLYHYVDSGWDETVSEPTWLAICKEWIDHCDILLRLPGESQGADAEVAYANSLNIPVVYTLEQLYEDILF